MIYFRLPDSLTRVRLRDFNLVWKLYDGYDWEHSRKEAQDALTRAKAQVKNGNVGGTSSSIGETSNISLETDNFVRTTFRNSDFDTTSQTASDVDNILDDHSDTSSQISSRLDSENISIREGKRPENSSRQSQLKLNRSKYSKLDIKLEKVNLDFDILPNDNLLAFKLLLLVRDIEILDNIKSSAWHKFLSHMRPDNDTSPRESKSNMIRIELNSVRPIPTDFSEELRLKVMIIYIYMQFIVNIMLMIIEL
jgi:autophagy-related protein 2